MIKQMIPNLCTSLNLVFGMLSIVSSMDGRLEMGAIFIFFAIVADGLDGRIARALGVVSEMGKEMDSLCDLGSFGIAPAVLAYEFCLRGYGLIGVFTAVIFALCGMSRLARFNVNTAVVHGYFMGLAIPAGGCIVASTTLLFLALGVKPEDFGYVYPVAMIIVAYLMISHVHYPDFKGGGDKLFLVPKIVAAVIFFATLYVGREAMIYGALTGFFGAYAVFGIVNSLFALYNKENS